MYVLEFSDSCSTLYASKSCRQLNHETKHCMEQLQCNIVVMKHSQPKVLRLNLVGLGARQPETVGSESKAELLSSNFGQLVTPSSSPGAFTPTEAGTLSVSGSDLSASPFSIAGKENNTPTKVERFVVKQGRNLDEVGSDCDYMSFSTSERLRFQPWIRQIFGSDENSLSLSSAHSTIEAVPGKLHGLREEARLLGSPSYNSCLDFNCNLREVISLSRKAPPGPPPLCSICQHKAPTFGKPPRWFAYADLELATRGFSQANFLAEGGYGSVHRGVLPDGQAVAVKQHKLASSQGDKEFCSEVEVLSCAQHRNVVMLIGFCIEDGRRLLVYEYICNGALDYHLYGMCRFHVPPPPAQT